MNISTNKLNTNLRTNTLDRYARVIFEEYNNDTGEVVRTSERHYKIRQGKKGWAVMYKTDMKEAILSIIDKPKVIRVWLFLWDKLKKDGTIVMPKIAKISSELNISRQTVSRALRTLKDEKIIEYDEENNIWYYNPFLFVISGVSDSDRHDLQQMWENMFGYYTVK